MKKNNIIFKKITRTGKKELADMNALLRQWSAKSRPMTLAYFKTLVKKSYVMGVYDGKMLIGTATLIPLYKLSGLKGSIEHVLISQDYRGRGLGKELMKATVKLAKKLKMEQLFLTSNPSRVIALALYKKMGFKAVDTTFFELPI